MIIYRHNYKDRTVLELEENELTLIAYLIEKSHHKLKDKMKEPLASKLNKKVQEFIKDEM
jgi:hypothetical protein